MSPNEGAPSAAPRGPGLWGRASRAAVIGLAVLLLASAVGGRAAPAPEAASEQEATRLQRQNEILAKQVELATSGKFYLLLEPETGRLRLFLHGAVLQDYRFSWIEVGVPRLSFMRQELPTGWRGKIWVSGDLVPAREWERVEIVAAPPKEGGNEDAPQVPIPPTPEEAYPVPPRYHLRFEGGLSLEVRPEVEQGPAKGFWDRLGERWLQWREDYRAVTQKPPQDAMRLRLTMPAKDAASFYRALPPETRLLILPPGDGASTATLPPGAK